MPGWMQRALARLNPVRSRRLAGKGALAITIEPKLGGQTYQGIVELSPHGIGASAEAYFAQSEQIAYRDPAGGGAALCCGRRAAALARRRHDAADDAGGREGGRAREKGSDDWERLSLLLKTVEDLELVDTSLAPKLCCGGCSMKTRCGCSRPSRSIFRCDCNTSRIVQVLKSYAPEDRDGLADPDGIIRARCEFCGKTHEIRPDLLT